MSSPGGAVVTASVGVGIAAANSVLNEKDPLRVVIAGGIFVVVTGLIAAANPQFGTALAVLFLLTVFLTSSDKVLKFITKLVNGK